MFSASLMVSYDLSISARQHGQDVSGKEYWIVYRDGCCSCGLIKGVCVLESPCFSMPCPIQVLMCATEEQLWQEQLWKEHMSTWPSVCCHTGLRKLWLKGNFRCGRHIVSTTLESQKAGSIHEEPIGYPGIQTLRCGFNTPSV